ncbi:phospholipase D-like domain-containing protein [Vibrio methylphosphonaticus]|uniref:phospholipase D-like domain-containing protein n=1 Tax=Vibrio methylphosphonaticus TaxID=2946866 RepID=UPI002029F2B4|nr:phospholipase D-like domain-containing protein [Vibrio methylphosphonaticus]MCL9776775.1 phospholipase D-like domain-containing protein [Vibrio methylphosphonaticus]
MWKGTSMLLLTGAIFGCTSNAHLATTSDDAWTSDYMEQRRWREPSELKGNYLKLASDTMLPAQSAHVKVIGTESESAIKSLASKIYLIENAQHTIDITYYIFADDLAGQATLGALCRAVKRGVDVRVMVDSLGSYSVNNGNLKGLMQCEQEAGYVLDRQGAATSQKARVQAVVFNALTNSDSKWNHRSHDKLFVVDAAYNEQAYVITGGRNMSLHYYGIDNKGRVDPTAFRDIEIVVRPTSHAKEEESPSRLSELYFSVLFTKPGNKKLDIWTSYNRDKQRLLSALTELKALPEFARAYEGIDGYLTQDYYLSETKLAHELDNLNAVDVVTQYSKNKRANANSISGILAKVAYSKQDVKTIKIVSPYLFLQTDLFKDEGIIEKDLNVTMKWLEQDPERRIEVITNSVLTSDNYFTQAVIDMNTAPNILMMDKETQQRWLDDELTNNEENKSFIASDAWKKMTLHPQVKFYQLGKQDSVLIGGDKYYGKLHAKFLIIDQNAFVGTTNLDFRSLLYNNEVGFFLGGAPLIDELETQFSLLKQDSLLWGSDEWLEMRRKLRDAGGTKGRTSSRQRGIFEALEETGLKYQF